MRLIAAEGPVLEQILDDSFPIWNEGLTRAGYAQWNAAQMRTAWGARHLQRLALVDEASRVLASVKRYRFTARLDPPSREASADRRGGPLQRPDPGKGGRRDVGVLGIGAVFTPESMRGRGYAAEAIERVIADEGGDGAAIAALFSEIGPDYYARCGFEAVPFEEVTLAVRHKPGAPAMLVRSGEDRDLPAVVAMHEARAAGARFALRRDTDLVQFAIARKRLLAGLGPSGRRQTEFFVAEEGTSAVAYVVITSGTRGWMIEEAGDRDPAGARLGAMLQVLLAREPSQQPPAIRAWWPASFPIPPQLEASNPRRAEEIFMIRPLQPDVPRLDARDIFYWHSDYF
jgi:hypothetical protein